MPPHWNLERLIGTALVDREFRAALLASPVTAAVDYGLTEEELAVLESAPATSLEDLAAHLRAWIIRAPQPKRGSTGRPALEGYQPVSVAV